MINAMNISDERPGHVLVQWHSPSYSVGGGTLEAIANGELNQIRLSKTRERERERERVLQLTEEFQRLSASLSFLESFIRPCMVSKTCFEFLIQDLMETRLGWSCLLLELTQFAHVHQPVWPVLAC